MKKFILTVFILSACTKEVGKKPYVLAFNFSSGDSYKIKGRVFEKNKKYSESETGVLDGDVMEGNKNAIVFGNNSADFREIFKTDNSLLTGTFPEVFDIANCIFANNQTVSTKGSLSLEGEYKSPFRKFKVESGTFTYKWANAEEYGMNDTILTGTWTLKRE